MVALNNSLDRLSCQLEDHNPTCVGQVFAITVTYGDRFEFVRKVVEAAIENGVAKVVVVDNGCPESSHRAIRELAGRAEGRIEIVALPTNLGSAAGFKAGLEYATRSSECEFIWLLDDDNQPAEGALSRLLEQHKRLMPSVAIDRLALASLREAWEQHRKIARGVAVQKIFPRHSSFIGFHLMIPPRIVSRLLHLERTNHAVTSEPTIKIPLAPYGGLFIHKTVIARLGYPDERFFLYNDDTEYTYRFTSNGGCLYLVPGSVVYDLDTSWHLVNEGETFVSHFLLADSDWRIYYATRNQSFVSRHFWTKSFLLYSLNKLAFFLLLGMYAARYWKWRRFALIAEAVRHGELGELGRRRDLEVPEVISKASDCAGA